jgi:hypothetical protein
LNLGKNDHGICAAYILYRDLCNIRKEEANSQNRSNNLCWEESLENVYNFASSIILAHNIWYVNKTETCTVCCYEQAGLNDLIFNGEYKIKLYKYPFLFLFCLVDTIEPYKRFKNIEILDNISLEILNDTIIIESNLICSCNETILNHAKSLNDWLAPAKKNGNTVIIKMKPKIT